MNEDEWIELEVLEEIVVDVIHYKVSIGRYPNEALPRLDITMYHTNIDGEEVEPFESYRAEFEMCQRWFDRLNWHKENIAY